MNKLVLLMILAVFGFAAFAKSTGALADEADKAPLLATSAGTCITGATTGSEFGFVVIGNNATDVLNIEVAIKDAKADATYTARLFQCAGTIALAPVVLGPVDTNGQGNGNEHFDHAKAPTATKAFVRLSSSSSSPGPATLTSKTVDLVP
jgi:hypothetical protein